MNEWVSIGLGGEEKRKEERREINTYLNCTCINTAFPAFIFI
jgi:hypothetical protein